MAFYGYMPMCVDKLPIPSGKVHLMLYYPMDPNTFWEGTSSPQIIAMCRTRRSQAGATIGSTWCWLDSALKPENQWVDIMSPAKKRKNIQVSMILGMPQNHPFTLGASIVDTAFRGTTPLVQHPKSSGEPRWTAAQNSQLSASIIGELET